LKNNFELAEIFSNNMVFQADKPLKIFGKCKKNIEIKIAFLNQETKIKTTENTFLVEFPPLPEETPAFSITITSKKQVVNLYNCLIGDVYLFFGGINMSMTLQESYHEREFDELDVRVFACEDEEACWQIAEKSNFTTFSALSYLFAKSIHEVIQKPIGIISCNHRESRIFSWMSPTDILSSPEMIRITDSFSEEEKLPLYSGIKSKIIPFALKALVFYQGEDDYPYCHVFEDGLKAVIKALRFDFHDLKLPFFVIQIAGYNHPFADDESVSLIRIAQANIANDKSQVYLVSAMDFGEMELINYQNKHLIAKRLANLTLEKIYKIGKNNESPRYFSHQVFPDHINVFTKGNFLNLVSSSNQFLDFTYSENRVDFQPLTGVKVNNNQIIIPRSDKTTDIRYAIKKYPAADIKSANGLPLLPFWIKIS
jgi:sialate O-acetylesterase